MTDDLKPCPFCGGGITTIEGGGQTWRGVNGYSDPQFYHLRHFGKLSETDDFPRCFVEFRCRTEAEAIAAWNTRALTEQLEAARADAKEAEAYAEELEKERDHWQDVAGREGVCMACRGPRGAPEPYGCSDCLNTGYCGEWHNEMQELREERERLALAICGGEDAPGYANAQTVETLEKVARDNANATMEQINRTLAAEAKLAKAVEALGAIVVDDTWGLDHDVYMMCRATLKEIKGESHE